MDADIHYRGPGSDVLSTHQQRLSGGHHQHLGLARECGQISAAGMGHGHRGIGSLEHQGHRLAHQDAAADHNSPGAF